MKNWIEFLKRLVSSNPVAETDAVSKHLPTGFEWVGDELRIDIDKFEPGMRPQIIESPQGKAYVDENGVRIETNTGNIFWHWRDGNTESLLRNIKSVAIHEDVQVSHSIRTPLTHGYVLNWYLIPRGSLHLTFDAKGYLSEVQACGVEIQTTPDGAMTVMGVVQGKSDQKPHGAAPAAGK